MNTEILQKIANNTSPKKNFQIIVSNNITSFNTVLNPSLQLNGNYEIALVGLETFYSFPNISESSKNNMILYTKGEQRFRIEIPTGSYEFDGLHDEIKRQLKNNGHEDAFKLIKNLNTLKTLLEVKSGYTVRFPKDNSIKSILGFTERLYSSGFHISENVINILSVNSIFVHVNVVNGSIVNGKQEPVIYTFFPKVSPGYKIIQNPKNPIYLPVALDNIRDFHVSLTDQNNNLLDLRGEVVTIRFHIRQV